MKFDQNNPTGCSPVTHRERAEIMIFCQKQAALGMRVGKNGRIVDARRPVHRVSYIMTRRPERPDQ